VVLRNSLLNMAAPRERRPSTSAPISELQGPIGPGFTRPKHKRTVTGFGPAEIKNVEASIPEPQRAAWKKFVSTAALPRLSDRADSAVDAQAVHHAR
jgi:hypothetical protein